MTSFRPALLLGCIMVAACAACGASSSDSSTVVAQDAAATSHDGGQEAAAMTAIDAAPVCSNDLPQSCPTAVPSYKTDVAPILQSRCATCHSPAGGKGYYEQTYAEVSAQASSVLDQVYECLMPPLDAPPLTAQQRQTLLGWLVCHAPDN